MPPIRPRPTHPAPRPAATPPSAAAAKPGEQPAEGKGGDEYPDKGTEGKTGSEQYKTAEQPGGKRNLGDVWKQLAKELIGGNADVVASALNVDADTMRDVLYEVADEWTGDQPK